MRIPRPYIPLSVRVAVARSQIWEFVHEGIASPCIIGVIAQNIPVKASAAKELAVLLDILSGYHDNEVLQLDHDPALILRKFHVDRRKPEAAWFTPNANDPDYLIYRPIRDHLQKTVGRRADAEKTVTTKGSDIWLKTKFRRLEQPRKKPKAKIPAKARPWPKRPFPRKRPASR